MEVAQNGTRKENVSQIMTKMWRVTLNRKYGWRNCGCEKKKHGLMRTKRKLQYEINRDERKLPNGCQKEQGMVMLKKNKQKKGIFFNENKKCFECG